MLSPQGWGKRRDGNECTSHTYSAREDSVNGIQSGHSKREDGDWNTNSQKRRFVNVFGDPVWRFQVISGIPEIK